MKTTPERALAALESSKREARRGNDVLAVAAGLRALTWGVMYVAEQLKRQADFWERGGP